MGLAVSVHTKGAVWLEPARKSEDDGSSKRR